MKESDTREDHGHTIFVRGLDDGIITSRAARFENVFHSAGGGAVNGVAEGEEGVGTESHRVKFGKPLMFFVKSQLSGRMRVSEDVSPVRFFVGRHIVTQELINRVVAVWTFDAGLERQIQNGGMLAQEP